MVERNKKTPLWVFLALSSINTRRGALWLVWSCIAFTIYCLPWSQLLPNQDWINKVFLIEEWDWFVMMVPIVIWYWLSLRWADNNSVWKESA